MNADGESRRRMWRPAFLRPAIEITKHGTSRSVTVRNEFALLAAPGLVLLALIAAGAQGLPWPLSMLRLLLGLLFVLYVPGYCLQAALFPAGDDPAASSGPSLDGPDRLALSFGLSFAIIPPLALVLDRLPWGIHLWPIVIAETLCIVVFALIAWYRRRRLPADQRFVLAFELDAPGWWAAQDRTNRRLFGMLGLAVCLAAVAAAAIIFLPRANDRFTEFYILGAEGLAENYPRETVAGQPVTVTMGIANREGVAAAYRAEVRDGERVIGQSGAVRLESGQTTETPVTFAPVEIGDDVTISFLLFRDDKTEPYRWLRLWLKVKAPQ